MQDLEANEFAGRLILPASMLYSCIYQSIDAVAKPD
jgi:Zn-dependent peptidase ImmA (M78 family)